MRCKTMFAFHRSFWYERWNAFSTVDRFVDNQCILIYLNTCFNKYLSIKL